jgi:hypothetical protein
MACDLMHDVLVGNGSSSQGTDNSSGDGAHSSSPLPPNHATLPPYAANVRLSCLSASAEQLEVLIEWFMQLCLECGEEKKTELRSCLQTKLNGRSTIQWYHRLLRSATEGKGKD